MVRGAALFLLLLLLVPTLLSAAEGMQDVSMTHEVTRLILQLGVIVLAAKLSGAVAERLRTPALIGEVSVGLLLGPYALGSLPIPGFYDGLVPLAEGAFPISLQLYGFAAVGAVVHVLVVGLESDSGIFARTRRRGLAIALGSSALSLLAGVLVALLFFGILVLHDQLSV
ncbi:MAG: cation:proton antiporter, partial [Alkalispirochaetaceae bacterium]